MAKVWNGRRPVPGRARNLFPSPAEHALGNDLPPVTGARFRPMGPGPAPQGYAAGQLGAFDGNVGNDPRAPQMQPYPVWLPGQDPNSMDSGMQNNPSDWRGGIQGYNDKLTVKDRHAYWDRGYQRTGLTGFPPAGSPNTYNDPLNHPPRPDLRTVNRTVSYQKGSDKTRFQDDLSRPYTWLGEQGSGWSRINGGVPGLYQPYGTRGGVPYPVQSRVPEGAAGDGPHLVFSGPPHGLHTQTPWKGGEQLLSRSSVLPQMRPVRVDRPSNSPQAGQSYSQTVRPQGASPVRPGTVGGPPRGQGPMQHRGRGWSGGGRKGWIQ